MSILYFAPPSTPVQEKQQPPFYVNMATQIANTITTSVNFGLTAIGNYLTNQNPPSPLQYSNINSPASSVTPVIASPLVSVASSITSVIPSPVISVASSRPISVHSSRPASQPVSVASSRPVSVHSSPHYPASPESPSYLPHHMKKIALLHLHRVSLNKI